jgi:hypothetical protein
MQVAYWTAGSLTRLDSLFALMGITNDPALQEDVLSWISWRVGGKQARRLMPVTAVIQYDDYGIDRQKSRLTFAQDGGPAQPARRGKHKRLAPIVQPGLL